MMPITASVSRSGAKSTAAFGNIGMANRRKPYVPILSSTPASTTEPAVGASVCASGSQVCNGNNGTFTANAVTNARKSSRLVSWLIECGDDDHWVSVFTSNDHEPV